MYGGGHAIDGALIEAGIEPRKQEGRRITGPREMQIIKKVMVGDLGFKVSATMSQLGLCGVTLNSTPSSWIEVVLRPRENTEDYGYDGRIEAVDHEKIRKTFEGINSWQRRVLALPTKMVSILMQITLLWLWLRARKRASLFS